MKTALLGLLAAFSLVPSLARAEVTFRPVGSMPRPPPGYSRGHYELKTVQQWVPARSENVWVNRECRVVHKRHFRREMCVGGYYQTRWIPGHYQPVQQWVWVSHFSPRPMWSYR